MLMHKVGEMQLAEFETLVRDSLSDPEPLVRETAAWALAQIAPEDLNPTLEAHRDDPSRQVREIISELLSITPKTSY